MVRIIALLLLVGCGHGESPIIPDVKEGDPCPSQERGYRIEELNLFCGNCTKDVQVGTWKDCHWTERP